MQYKRNKTTSHKCYKVDVFFLLGDKAVLLRICERLQITEENTDTPITKWGEVLKQHFTNEDIQAGPKPKPQKMLTFMAREGGKAPTARRHRVLGKL